MKRLAEYHAKCNQYTVRYDDGECTFCSRKRKHDKRVKPLTTTYTDEGWEVTITMRKLK
jgi:hypothetical protein